jgi:hypothetical protein
MYRTLLHQESVNRMISSMLHLKKAANKMQISPETRFLPGLRDCANRLHANVCYKVRPRSVEDAG